MILTLGGGNVSFLSNEACMQNTSTTIMGNGLSKRRVTPRIGIGYKKCVNFNQANNVGSFVFVTVSGYSG